MHDPVRFPCGSDSFSYVKARSSHIAGTGSALDGMVRPVGRVRAPSHVAASVRALIAAHGVVRASLMLRLGRTAVTAIAAETLVYAQTLAAAVAALAQIKGKNEGV